MKQAHFSDDKEATRALVKAFASDCPAQLLVGKDDRDLPAVILHFADLNGNESFETVFFSSQAAAKEAFEFLKSIETRLYDEPPF